MKDLGIIPSREAMAQLMNATTPSETGQERQARMVGCVLLGANRNFGVRLPEGVEKALAEDS